MTKCNVCGKNFALPKDGVALMMAFVHRHTTALVNVSICNWCYREYGIDDAIKTLNKSACLHIELPEDEAEEDNEQP
jgi:hypothetical protein